MHYELGEILATACQAKMWPQGGLSTLFVLRLNEGKSGGGGAISLAYFQCYCTLERFVFIVVPVWDEEQIRNLAQLN